MTKIKSINIAQAGIGYWGPNLLRNLVTNRDCYVKKVVDISEERCAFVASTYPSVLVTNRIEEVLNDSEVEAVIIATPAATHFELAMKALESGKHVLVEKPMACSVDEVEQISNLADEKKLVAMVGHTFIYNSAVRYVKKLIDSSELGNIRYIYSQRVNLGRIRSDVDVLWNLAPHDVSIIQYWLGNPRPISISQKGMAYVQNGVNDVVFMNITYPDNVMANIHVSWLDPQKIRRITVVGSEKMVIFDDIAENKIAIYDKGIDRIAVLGERMDFDDPGTFNFNHRSGDVVMPKINWQEPLKVEIEHFVDCIQNGTPCLTDANHAKSVVGILSMNSEQSHD